MYNVLLLWWSLTYLRRAISHILFKPIVHRANFAISPTTTTRKILFQHLLLTLLLLLLLLLWLLRLLYFGLESERIIGRYSLSCLNTLWKKLFLHYRNPFLHCFSNPLGVLFNRQLCSDEIVHPVMKNVAKTCSSCFQVFLKFFPPWVIGVSKTLGWDILYALDAETPVIENTSPFSTLPARPLFLIFSWVSSFFPNLLRVFRTWRKSEKDGLDMKRWVYRFFIYRRRRSTVLLIRG